MLTFLERADRGGAAIDIPPSPRITRPEHG